MRNSEFEELLQHVREAIRRRDRADLDDNLMASRFIENPQAADQLIRYLEGMRDDFQMGSERVSRQTLRRFRNVVQTGSGESVQGIVVDVVDEDRPAYGIDAIRLTGSPSLDEVVARLDNLIRELRQSRENS